MVLGKVSHFFGNIRAMSHQKAFQESGGGWAPGSSLIDASVICALQMSQGIPLTGNRMLVGGPQECTDFEAGRWHSHGEGIQARERLWSGPHRHQGVKTSLFVLPALSHCF